MGNYADIKPATNVRLLRGVNIQADYRHTLYFANRTAQTNFMISKTDVLCEEFMFIKGTNRGGQIKIMSAQIIAQPCNYMMFMTGNIPEKWIYCFITNVTYVNDNVTLIDYEIDYLQTYMFDVTLHASFVERETVAIDDPGYWNIDDMPAGEMVSQIDTVRECDFFKPPYYNPTDNDEDERLSELGNESNMTIGYLIQTTINLEKLSDNYTSPDISSLNLPTAFNRGNYYTDGIGLYFIEKSRGDTIFSKFMESIIVHGLTDRILSMWLYPKFLINYGTTYDHGDGWNRPIYTVLDNKTNSPLAIFDLPVKPTTCAGINVRNKRLLHYPYTQIVVNNNNGSGITLSYDKFYDPESPYCRMQGTTTAEAKIRLIPNGYEGACYGEKINSDYGIDSVPMPSVSWVNDSYAIWLAQNRNTIMNNFDQTKIGAIRGIGNAALGGATSVVSGNTAGLLNNTLNMVNTSLDSKLSTDRLMAQVEDMKLRPDTASGIQSTGLSLQNGKGVFSAYVIQPERDRVKQLDSYFTMYGYSVNRLKAISLKNRQRWTYIKTTGLNITGSVPHAVLQTIKNIFDNGITFWANNNEVGNYSLDNGTLY